MQRRDFIGLISGVLVGHPLAALAQPANLPTIGFLGAGSETSWAPMVAAFDERLRQIGWSDGQTITIVYRWAEGKSDRYREIATEFIQRRVNVILTVGSAVAAVKQATTSIPIIFAASLDPVASGFVDSLARPGGNVTGLSLQSSDIAPKRIEILREAIPDLHHLAVLANAGYPGAARESTPP